MTTIERFGLSWTAIKAVHMTLGTILYEGNGFTYRIFTVANQCIFECWITSSADKTDYETNHRAEAVIVESGDIAYSKYAEDNSLVPVYTVNEYVNQYTETTTTSVTANRQVFTWTVPANKTFYLISHSIIQSTTSQNSVGASPARWLKNGVVFEKAFIDGNQAQRPVTEWFRSFPYAIPLATAGDVITATVTPTSKHSTVWATRLVGRVM